MFYLDTLLNKLQADGIGTVGVDLFMYFAPDDVDNCIIVTGGTEPPQVCIETPKYYKGKIQIIIRNKEYDAGFAKCDALMASLTDYNFEDAKAKFKQILPLHLPRVYRRAESGIIEMSINFDIRFIEK